MEKERNIKQENSIVDINSLCRNSIELVHYSRVLAVRSINYVEIMTNFILGKWIVEEQQFGSDRAQYGDKVIEKLSEALTQEFGRGFSVDSLTNFRKFYMTYKDKISESLMRKFVDQKSEPLVRKFAEEKVEPMVRQFKESIPFTLPWTHYLILMRIKDPNERSFYEIEASKYQLYLPDKKLLQGKLRSWIEEES